MIRLGTSSWQFEGWQGVFYPETLPKDQQLIYYSKQFDTVEVNTSFYGLPRPSTLVKWVESTPLGFQFCLKAPRAITHDKRLNNAQEESRLFLEVLRSLGTSAAPAFLQFPPTFTRQTDGKALALYIDWLAGQLNGIRMGVEVRSADLLTPAFATFLADRGFCLVLIDRVETADLFDSWLTLIDQKKAPQFVIIRWIGDDRNGPQGDSELVAPRDAQLEQWAKRLIQLEERGIEVFGYMHNPYEGHSPASIRRLRSLLVPNITLPTWPPPSEESDQLVQPSLL